jgi:hypothetical protein
LKSCGSGSSICHPAKVFERGHALEWRQVSPVAPVVILVVERYHRERAAIEPECGYGGSLRVIGLRHVEVYKALRGWWRWRARGVCTGLNRHDSPITPRQ